ncbi:MAG TPA: hypothetical protein VHR41_16505 [Gemmatimonadales bacterium]|jgi:hypothetical protein|nr:hypothetical protein [Gemmatimonadales bacterium]
MPKKFKTRVQDFKDVSDDLEMVEQYLVQLDMLIQSIDWTALFADYPDPGGGLPPPNVPKWPP